MSKVEKSDSLFSLGERIWEYKVYLVLGMSFISSLFAPVAAILGWPATIIIITSLSSSSVLLLLSFWKEFNHKRELKKEEEISDIKLNCDRAKEIDGILIRATNSKPVEQIQLYNQAMILMRDFPEIKKQRTIEVARKICGENVTQEQQSTIYTLLEKYEPFRDKVNELLAAKGLEAIKKNLLSKQSVEFLSSITDNDLESLKKQFKYVLKIPHEDHKSGISSQDLAIWHFEDANSMIQNLLLKENGLMHLESYHIKFYGDIWVGEATRASAYLLKNNPDLICDIDTKQTALQICYKQEPVKGMIVNQIFFPSYVCLSGIGMEIFNLLKDEIESPPHEYLSSITKYWGERNPQYNFSIIEKTKLITC